MPCFPQKHFLYQIKKEGGWAPLRRRKMFSRRLCDGFLEDLECSTVSPKLATFIDHLFCKRRWWKYLKMHT
jgi:hypothetical protein